MKFLALQISLNLTAFFIIFFKVCLLIQLPCQPLLSTLQTAFDFSDFILDGLKLEPLILGVRDNQLDLFMRPFQVVVDPLSLFLDSLDQLVRILDDVHRLDHFLVEEALLELFVLLLQLLGY